MSRTNSQAEVIIRCRPFIKWAGGKSRLMSELGRSMPSRIDRYFEPFLGGGAMFFYLISNREFSAFLSDNNPDLITTYDVIRSEVEELIHVLSEYESEYFENPEEFYYELRGNRNLNGRVQTAARFITLNRTCYNGLYRVNQKGIFNVPFGGYENPTICDFENLRAVSSILRRSNAQIQRSDFFEACKNAESGDFLYFDPPYDPTSKTSSFTRYTPGGFGDEDQRQLADLFQDLDERGCYVMLSNSDTPLIRNLYSSFARHITRIIAPRFINCKGSKRTGHKELIIRNF
jgi:DNA adenine methylase